MELLSSTIDYGIIGILLSMSVLAVAVAVERLLCYKRTHIELFVAIPTVVLYNFLLRSTKELILKWEIANGRKGL